MGFLERPKKSFLVQSWAGCKEIFLSQNSQQPTAPCRLAMDVREGISHFLDISFLPAFGGKRILPNLLGCFFETLEVSTVGSHNLFPTFYEGKDDSNA